ncbi:hypothetical protein EGW08_006406 [Elysia chlorotica]|uniref:Uncharacterized protein n=1 Tax=Elysia chlorotica TaxID=188477 RepID=A0A3S0ZY04_ELYCH|nr:hypothetical protein EGW08_006406 [Elysia chlorotica]
MPLEDPPTNLITTIPTPEPLIEPSMLSASESAPSTGSSDIFPQAKETDRTAGATSDVSSTAPISIITETESSDDSLLVDFSKERSKRDAPLDWGTTADTSLFDVFDSKDENQNPSLDAKFLDLTKIEVVGVESQTSNSGSAHTSSLLWIGCVALGARLLPKLILAVG